MIPDLKMNTEHSYKIDPYQTLFPFVNKPSRYIGGEWNSIRKPESFRKSAVSLCLCFPDLYETGFANVGIEILYQIVNARDDAYAERVYSADSDLAKRLRENRLPLFSLETRTPVGRFDILGFGLPYELCYNNILEVLDLAGVPLRASQRNAGHPLIIGGGPCAVNPEPIADFFDVIILGDGEDAIGEIVEEVKKFKQSGRDRNDLLLRLAQKEGLYVPALYDVRYHSDDTIAEIRPRHPQVPPKVGYRRADLQHPIKDGCSFPIAPVVPFVQTVHDRFNVEIQRGCPWRCRFCQAGFTYRPYRERSREELVQIVHRGLKNTGYDAVTLAGLSSADHTEIVPLLQELSDRLTPKRISLGLPSTRSDRFNLALAEILNAVRRQSVTFAPEAGTERMRRVIRKELQESEIRQTLNMARQHGWKSVKLYFMYGLPTETQADLQGIVDLARASRKENPGLSLTLTLSPFVPKPHTPYQWHPQDRYDILVEKLAFLRKSIPAQIRAHGLEQILIEGVLARGDRRCSQLIETAWKMGSTFDEWGERFNFGLWQKAFEACGLKPEFYCTRERAETEIFPWDHLQGGPDKKALWNDYRSALRQAQETEFTPHLKERPPVPEPKKVVLPPEKVVQRLRFKFSREGTVRFLSHLEQIEMLRRTLRRADMPVAHTSGFHPQIKCAFGPAISVGYESDCEYMDVDLTRRLETEDARQRIAAQLPSGFQLARVSRIPLFFPSLESLINRVEYRVIAFEAHLKGTGREDWTALAQAFAAREDVVIEKKKKGRNGAPHVEKTPLRSVLLGLDWQPHASERADEDAAMPYPVFYSSGQLNLSLKYGPGKNVKPEKIAAQLFGLSEEESKQLIVRRTGLWIDKPEGGSVEP